MNKTEKHIESLSQETWQDMCFNSVCGIRRAMREMYLMGAMDGGLDRDIFYYAMNNFSKSTITEDNREL